MEYAECRYHTRYQYQVPGTFSPKMQDRSTSTSTGTCNAVIPLYFNRDSSPSQYSYPVVKSQ